MTFTYTDDQDKSYGLTGMVISLNVFDQNDMVSKLSLDDEDAIEFTPDFYFCTNPRYSAKIAWNEMVKQYQMLTGMIIGNILCRQQVYHRQAVTRNLIDDMRALVDDEGRDDCQLEKDEIDMIFNKTFNYLTNVYSDSRINTVAHRLAAQLMSSRSLTHDDLADLLSM